METSCDAAVKGASPSRYEPAGADEWASARVRGSNGCARRSARWLLEIPAGELGAGGQAGLREDAPDVAFHRALGQHELARHLTVGQRLSDKLGDLALAGGERILGTCRGGGVGEERV